MSEIDTVAKDSTEKGFFGKLANGDFGLAKTYWIYGVLVGVVVNMFFSLLESRGVITIALLAYIVYAIPVIMGTWRAATKYAGPKIWAVLANIACVLGALQLALGLLAIVGLMENA